MTPLSLSILFIIALVVAFLSLFVSFHYAGNKGGLTTLLLWMTQNLFSFKFPVIIATGVTITPAITFGLLAAITLLIFGDKYLRFGSASYLISGLIIALIAFIFVIAI